MSCGDELRKRKRMRVSLFLGGIPTEWTREKTRRLRCDLQRGLADGDVGSSFSFLFFSFFFLGPCLSCCFFILVSLLLWHLFSSELLIITWLLYSTFYSFITRVANSKKDPLRIQPPILYPPSKRIGWSQPRMQITWLINYERMSSQLTNKIA